MNETDIRKYAQLMKELDLTGLEITQDNKMVRLERGIAAPAVQTVASEVSVQSPVVQEDADYISIKSPIVGLFYAAPAENAEPYVSLGDTVRKGQTVGIVEAMKMMNEIGAEADGVVAQICVSNGQMVEYGTELFRIRR